MNKVKVGVVTVFVLLMLFGAQHLSALFVLNDGGRGWRSDNQPVTQIDNSIVDGASSFLKAHAEVLLFLNKIELANSTGLDYVELQKNLDVAIMHMENARIAYLELKTIANESPYNPSAIKNLKKFNYKEYETTNGLNPFIFEKVVQYLKVGNIRGVFNQFYVEVGTILTQLYDLKAAVVARSIPEVAKMWRLNQSISDTQFFGQYAAEIFATLEN